MIYLFILFAAYVLIGVGFMFGRTSFTHQYTFVTRDNYQAIIKLVLSWLPKLVSVTREREDWKRKRKNTEPVNTPRRATRRK